MLMHKQALEVVKAAVEAVPAANLKKILEKTRETAPDMTMDQVVSLARTLELAGEIQGHGAGEAVRYYPGKLEMKAEDLTPGTAFEVKVTEDGEFRVWVFYSGVLDQGYNGEGYGATFAQAATMAIQDAEGELEWEAEES